MSEIKLIVNYYYYDKKKNPTYSYLNSNMNNFNNKIFKLLLFVVVFSSLGFFILNFLQEEDDFEEYVEVNVSLKDSMLQKILLILNL